LTIYEQILKMISVIILSNTLDEEIYQINVNCIRSLLESENWEIHGGLEILLIESNRNHSFVYDKSVKVLMPEEPFNFNRFLNIGVRQSSGEFIALCNNDILFSPGWFTEILKVEEKNTRLLCFSPVDRNYPAMSYDVFPEEKDYYIGWNNQQHFAAWCFIVKRNIFSITGKFDETFNFYSADDDFLLTLRKNALDNALVTHSHVKHLSGQVVKKMNGHQSQEVMDKIKYPIPQKYLNRGFSWIWMDIRFYEAFFKMLEKWGDEKMIRRINRFLENYPFLRKRLITRRLYSKKVNNLMSLLD
jgi:GT2 family glycosyltransferase